MLQPSLLAAGKHPARLAAAICHLPSFREEGWHLSSFLCSCSFGSNSARSKCLWSGCTGSCVCLHVHAAA